MDLDRDDHTSNQNREAQDGPDNSHRPSEFENRLNGELENYGSPSSQSLVATDYTIAKWNHLAKAYNDEYQNLFSESLRTAHSDTHFETSQLGSVTWTGDEKEKFFEALASKGRHDLPALAHAVQTKSMFEIKDYLLILQEADADRQRFSVHAKNTSHIDINAAVEIDANIEETLEKVADALSAFQDVYDEAEAKSKRSGPWKIDSELAASIAEENDAQEDRGDEEGDAGMDDDYELNPDPVQQFFHFDTLLELSTTVFMNMPEHSFHGHWTNFAEGDEEPSLTMEAAEEFYNIVKSLVQKVLQTAIFLAESRLRSMSTSVFIPARVLKDTDIEAALNVLNMPIDSFDYWIGALRRSETRIVLGGSKEQERNHELTLEQAREGLSVRAARGRHRSLSSMISGASGDHQAQSQPQHESISRSYVVSRVGEAEDEEVVYGEGREQAADAEPPELFSDESEFQTSHSIYEDSRKEVESSGSDSSLSGGTSSSEKPDTNERNNRKRHRQLMEEAQDEYMERLDSTASLKEGNRLRKLLGFGVSDESESEELGLRPRKLRKTKEELIDWSELPFASLWETQIPFRENVSPPSGEPIMPE